jgi:hypothetical protein
MKLRHCRPKCAGTTIKGSPCGMTATAIGGKVSKFCIYHDARTRAEAIASNERRKAAYWKRWRLMNELAKTAPANEGSKA